jgi:hypothetical protein
LRGPGVIARAVVRQVVNRKEVVVRVEAASPKRNDQVLAPKSVAKFDVSGQPLAWEDKIS